MTDQALNRWIVENVFKECWPNWVLPDEYDSSNSIHRAIVTKHCSMYGLTELNHPRPNLCTPDGSAMLKAKAQELGVWEGFVLWLWEDSFCIYTNDTGRKYSYPELAKLTRLKTIERATTPRLFAEAFRAYWQERGK